MPLYEHVFLARQDLAQAQVDAIAENATKIITDNKGKVVKTETWGLKSLAYRIAKNRKAHYVMLEIDAPGGVVAGAAGLLGLGRPNLLFGWFAVGVALTQVFLPYMVLSLYDALDAQDPRLHDAAAGLGAGPAERFLRVALPLSLPGLRAGVVLVFLLSSTAYVSATLVGGRKVWVSGMVVLREGLENLDYPLAAAVAMLMLAASVAATAAVGVAFRC